MSGFVALAETRDPADPRKASGSQVEDPCQRGGWETGYGWWGQVWGKAGVGRLCCSLINNLPTHCCPHGGHCWWCHPGARHSPKSGSLPWDELSRRSSGFIWY